MVDVGNGFSTFVPTLVFLVGMTAHAGAGEAAATEAPVGWTVPFSARTLGIIGFPFFWQMLYGTCVYAFSFVYGRRYKRLSYLELATFVGTANGVWIVFPVLGMHTCWRLVEWNSFALFL